jgi:hypothetical protein
MGGISPKTAPFFHKKLCFKNAKYISTQEFGRIDTERERPKGEDG